MFEDLLGETIEEGNTVSYVSKIGNKMGMFVGRVEETFMHRGIPHVKVEGHSSSVSGLNTRTQLLTNLDRIVRVN